MATFRPLVPGDYPAVAQMANEAASAALVGRPTWETAAEVSATLAGSHQVEFIVAEADDGHIQGFAGYALAPDGLAHLYGPLVTQQGHGVGAWLSSRIENMAKSRGATAYEMLIGLDNGQGAAWAEWRGYQREPESPDMLLTWLYPGELRVPAPAPEAVVRRAAPADLDAVEGLYRECYQADTATRADWQAWLPSTWVLEEPAGLVGLVHLDRAASAIRHLSVRPGRRRRGLGTWLVAEAVQAYLRERPAKVGLALPLDNRSGVALARRLGFRREIPVARWMKRDR